MICFFNKIKLACVIFFAFILCNLPAYAQEVKSLDQLLNEVKISQGETGRRDQQREQRFLDEKNNRQKLLKEAKAQLKQTEKEGKQLNRQFEKNEKEVARLTEALHKATGNLGEMFGVVRQAAGDSQAIIDSSLISAQLGNRANVLTPLADAKALPSVNQLEQLWFVLLQEMTESSKVVRFDSQVVTPDGQSQAQEVVRIGAFTAVSDGQFLKYLPETQQLMAFSRQPGDPHQSISTELQNTAAGNTVAATIDPTRGAVLGILVQVPNTWERIQQGGFIGYVILGIGLLGVLIALERFVRLNIINRRIKWQLQHPNDVKAHNPLGRVLAVFNQHQDKDMEVLELRMDEAILKETPQLSRGIRFLKLLAAVAPLLGLLGTVVGMIATFQAISLFGTGDPKLMAGGISQALVTTMLGLFVAIPLLFLHANISARSQRCLQILDQQCAGLIAQRTN